MAYITWGHVTIKTASAAAGAGVSRSPGRRRRVIQPLTFLRHYGPLRRRLAISVVGVRGRRRRNYAPPMRRDGLDCSNNETTVATQTKSSASSADLRSISSEFKKRNTEKCLFQSMTGKTFSSLQLPLVSFQSQVRLCYEIYAKRGCNGRKTN